MLHQVTLFLGDLTLWDSTRTTAENLSWWAGIATLFSLGFGAIAFIYAKGKQLGTKKVQVPVWLAFLGLGLVASCMFIVFSGTKAKDPESPTTVTPEKTPSPTTPLQPKSNELGEGVDEKQKEKELKPVKESQPGAKTELRALVLPVKVADDIQQKVKGEGGGDLADRVRSRVQDCVTSMAQAGCPRVIDREQLQAVLKEQSLSETGLFDENTALRVGKLALANLMISAKISSYSNAQGAPLEGVRAQVARAEVSIRVQDVNTTEVLISRTFSVKGTVLSQDPQRALDLLLQELEKTITNDVELRSKLLAVCGSKESSAASDPSSKK